MGFWRCAKCGLVTSGVNKPLVGTHTIKAAAFVLLGKLTGKKER